MANDENKIILEFPATNVEIELGETITFDNISGFLDSGRVTYDGDSLTEKITHLENDKADTTYVNTELDKKADKTDTYTKAQVDDIVYGILPDDTASGSVANFTTSLELPIKSLEVDVNAVQESGTPTPATPLPISGRSGISVIHCGKNLIDTAKSYQQSSNVVVIGQNNAYLNHDLFLKKSTYTIRVNASVTASVYYHTGTASVRVGATNTNPTFTLSEDEWISFYVYTSQGVSVSDIVDYQLELGSVATEYEPYVGNEYIINLGGTYYGGHFTQDKDGHRQFEVTCAKEHISLQGKTYDTANGFDAWLVYLTNRSLNAGSSANKLCSVCNNYRYENSSANIEHYYIASQAVVIYLAENTFRDGEFDIVYPLATPYVIDLPDGEPINTLIGTNNIFADTGDTNVVFKDSVNGYVEKKVANVQALALNT